MKKKEVFAEIYLVVGTAVRFTGETKTTTIGAFINYNDALNAGIKWENEEQERYNAEGLNWDCHADTETINLYR